MELPESILDAVESGDLEAVQRWLAQNPDCIELCGKEGDTLLCSALCAPRSDVLRFLIAKGADVNDNRDGISVLHVAVDDPEVQSRIERARLLLDAGAEIDIRDVSFQTPLMIAASEGHFDVTRLLVSRGANVGAQDNFGEDAYAMALESGAIDCANFLFAVLEAGGWPAYVADLRQPRIDLLMLRLLCQDGRAAAPAGTVLERLFAPPPPEPARRSSRSAARRRSVARTTLPKEVFWHVVSFWRCDRDLVRHY
jgi:hypothetical protein